MKLSRKRNDLALCVLPVLLALLNYPMTIQARTYTLDADFDEGVLAGVEHDTVHDQLQLSEQLVTLPFIWVANSGENTVSKINTETGVELGRYRTGPGTEDPSRTTVDLNGDLWVGNRLSSTAVKIALYPTDTTGGEATPRPDIFTPADSTPDGILTTSTGPLDVKPWGEDDAVVMRIAVDRGPRALAVDASNNVWIGGTGSGSGGITPGNTMGYFHGDTGANLKNISIGRYCYGALIDGNGTLWISNQSTGFVTRIDNPSGTHTMTPIPTGDGGWVYGIGIDAGGYIYTSAWTNNRIRKLDPSTNMWVYSVPIPGGSSGRGVCVGSDGDVWVAHSGAHSVTRHDAANGNVKATVSVGNTPTGVATDAAGKIWVTNLGSHNIMRINPAMNTVDFTQGGHTSPYNYSDMTGIISRTITTKTGTWTVDFDSGIVGTPWGTISWNSNEPVETSVTIRASSSTDGSSWSGWETATNGVALSATPPGQYIRVEATLQITSGDVSPILYDLTVLPANQPPTADAGDDQIVEQTSYDGAVVTLDGSGSTDPDSTPGTNDNIAFFDWYEGTIYLGSGETLSKILQLGTHTVTLVVTDYFGETDEDDVVITVEDTMPPEIVCSVDPEVLWSPNHKMVPVIVVIVAEDICTKTDLLEVSVTVTSSEPDDAKGDGAFTGDVDGEDGFTAPVPVTCVYDSEAGCFVCSFALRAERDGRDVGRTYTVTTTVTDLSGNMVMDSCTVVVPHDQGQ